MVQIFPLEIYIRIDFTDKNNAWCGYNNDLKSPLLDPILIELNGKCM
jgi:hypothetical protein